MRRRPGRTATMDSKPFSDETAISAVRVTESVETAAPRSGIFIAARTQLTQTASRVQHNMKTFRFSKSKQTNDGQQSNSRLFKLPLEIRQQIWNLALAPPQNASSPHFHLYDEIIDTCTYHPSYKLDKERRKSTTKINLLLTCRAIYHEAVHYLYDDTIFTLVLFAGRARPSGNLKFRHSLGALEDCKGVLNRMRMVRLVIQPGSKRPDTEKYVARIALLLGLTNNFANVKKLCLHFNFHNHFLMQLDGEERFQSILNAFYPLETKREPILLLPRNIWAIDPDDLPQPFLDLKAALPTSTYLLGSDFPPELAPDYSRDKCHRRGCYGHIDNYPMPRAMRTRRHKVIEITFAVTFLSACLVTLPISGPAMYAMCAKRAYDKGEW